MPITANSVLQRTALAVLLTLPMAPASARHYPWQATVASIRADLEQAANTLDEARQRLLAQPGIAEGPLAARLSSAAPAPVESGYGIVPDVNDEAGTPAGKACETRYSLAELRSRSRAAIAAAERIAARARRPGRDLDELVTRYEATAEELENANAHLRYHDYWQRAIADNPAAFQWHNDTLGLLRQRDGLLANAQHSTVEMTTLQAQIEQRVTAFRPVENIAPVASTERGQHIELVLHTDIAEPDFLQAVREALERHWNQAQAMRAARLRIELSVAFLPASRLYPQGPPARGADIDLAAHAARFPDGALLVTTGARSTHAWTGRSVLLGPAPMSLRALAHELGHLLGFDDAYVRGYEGQSDSANGMVIVERCGIGESLMADPAAGVVTASMVSTLLDAYAGDIIGCPCDAPGAESSQR